MFVGERETTKKTQECLAKRLVGEDLRWKLPQGNSLQVGQGDDRKNQDF